MNVRAWARFAAVIFARVLLAGSLGMLFWAVAPTAIGWHTTTVMTASMAPAIEPGDLVVSRPAPYGPLHPGQVLLTQDPDHRGWLRLHRLDSVRDGEFITKGDANREADSSPVRRADVQGIGYLRVPWIGIPVRAVLAGDVRLSSVTLLAVALTVTIALLPAVRLRDRGSDDEGDSAALEEKQRPWGGTVRRLRGRHVALLVVIATAASIGLVSPANAASFSASSRAKATLQAATAQPVAGLTCSNNWNGSVTVSWTYTADQPIGFDVLIDGRGTLSSLGPNARNITVWPNSPFSFGSTSVIRVRTNLTPTWIAATQASVNVTTVSFFWFGAARCQ